MADIVVFVPPGSRVRYSPSQYIADDGAVVIMPAEALERPDASTLRLPEGIRLALIEEPLVDAQPFVDVQALIDRLQHAERVCAMFGRCPAGDMNSNPEAATTELWLEWALHVGESIGSPAFPSLSDFPDLTDEAVTALAERRRATIVALNAGTEGAHMEGYSVTAATMDQRVVDE
jgi:hypothetical protein